VIASEAISMIRFRTGRDNSGHFLDSSLYPELDLEVRKLRRVLQDRVPKAFTTSTTAPSISGNEITVPATFDKIVRLEELASGSGTTARYVEVPAADVLRPQDGSPLAWREEGNKIILTPPDDVTSVLGWRLTYVANTSVVINDGTDLLDVPSGFEEVVVLRVSATVLERTKDEEAAARFRLLADGNPAAGVKGVLDELLSAFRRRYGVHARPGFTPTRAYGRRGGIP
jgi:hypothetical protein